MEDDILKSQEDNIKDSVSSKYMLTENPYPDKFSSKNINLKDEKDNDLVQILNKIDFEEEKAKPLKLNEKKLVFENKL